MSNKYENDNKQFFDELMQIVSFRPTHYANIIRGKKHLLHWINSILPLLADPIYDLRTKVYWIINGLEAFPKCKNYEVCQHDFSGRNIRNLKAGYGVFCSSKCSNTDAEHNEKIVKTRKQHESENPNYLNDILKKQRATKLARYNDETYTNREKASKTCMEKYGTNWFVETDIFKEKAAKTCFEHFGVDCSFKSPECREKAQQTCLEQYGDPHYRNAEKTKQTCIEKYGVDNPAKSPLVKEKTMQTFIEHYGTDNNMKSEVGYAKWQQAIFEKYGVDHNWKAEECKAATKKTLLEMYGMEHTPSWKYCYDEKSFDSSWELAYYIWLKDNKIPFEYPCLTHFKYKDGTGKEHVYNPDFKVEDQIVEIKGTQFIDSEKGLASPYDRAKQCSNDILIDGIDPKYKCMCENNVIILSKKEMQQYLDYVADAYGADYLKRFKKSK